jgi:hypothetical protein
VNFYREVANFSGADAAKRIETLIGVEEHNEFYEDAGEFLPLSVWTNRGFDAERIKENTPLCDVREDRVLGTCYRVKILKKGNAGHRGARRESKASAGGIKRPANRMLEELESGVVDGDDESASSKSDSSSESSSSSSSSRKKSKKKSKKEKKSKKNKKDRKKHKKEKKETPAERKAKEALQKAKEKEREKAKAANVKAAEAIVSKVSQISTPLKLLLENSGISQLAPLVRDQLTSAKTKFEALLADAEVCVVSQGETRPSGDIKEVLKDIASTKKSMALATSLLALISRARPS